MKNSHQVVVVPVHSESPSAYELISFAQCFSVLKYRDIVVIAPEGLNLSEYNKCIPEFNTRFIDRRWQSSVLNYNKLKLSRYFYRLFKDYEFLLTYELDAFVFRDELDEWCEMPYDYIGAPWFIGYDQPTKEFLGVGNSGFSLRRIEAVVKLLDQMYDSGKSFQAQKQNTIKIKAKLGLFKLLSLGRENYSIQRFTSLYEDQFLCGVAAKINTEFRIAPINDAMRFSFETNPEFLFEANDRQLPMGCHAWWRYNLAFWKPHIESFGYSLNMGNDSLVSR